MPAITVTLPADCHVTIAVNDASGRRIRNLVSDVELNIRRARQADTNAAARLRKRLNNL
jgi:hypothetical protein